VHTTPKDIAKLWKLSQKPAKLYEQCIVWQAGLDVDKISSACEELEEFETELRKEMELSDGGAAGPSGDAKKKTT
jgi:hypothetical protein